MQQVEFIIKLLELSADIKELKHSFMELQIRKKYGY